MTDNQTAIKSYVAYRLHELQYAGSEAATKALLAKLRHGVGKTPGEDPQLWGVVFDKLPEQLMGKAAEPSYSEWAVYTALTLYALHQQGKDPKTESVNREGDRLGVALRRLVAPMGDENRVKHRFDAIATSGGISELANHARGAIKLMSANGIPLDYPSFAVDLYRYQFPELRNGVRLNWGRDYYRSDRSEDEPVGDTADSN